MGLDMYAHRVAEEHAVDDFTVACNENDEGYKEELFYWRKHHNLHGWMERLYRDKGGSADSFNCVYVRLTMEDLDRLEKDILGYKLPETTGFFFGNNPPDEDSVREDMKFVAEAKVAVASGDAVYYSSWW